MKSVQGRIVHKRKHHTGITYAIQPPFFHFANDNKDDSRINYYDNTPSTSNEGCKTPVVSDKNNPSLTYDLNHPVKTNLPPTLVLIPRNHPCVPWCFVGAIVHVEWKSTALEKEEKKEEVVDVNVDCAPLKISRINTDTAIIQDNKQFQKRKTILDCDEYRVELIQCSPDPNAIVACLQMVVSGVLCLDVFPSSIVLSSLQHVEQIRRLLAKPPKDEDRRKLILRISRHLQGNNSDPNNESQYYFHHPDAKKYGTSSKTRKPKIKRRYWYVIEEMEKIVPLEVMPVEHEDSTETTAISSPSIDVQVLEKDTIVTEEDIPAQEEEVECRLPSKTVVAAVVNVPDVNAMSNKHQISRVDYMKIKKWPQIQWLLEKLEQVLGNVKSMTLLSDSTTAKKYFKVLDVGGGRGDLAVAIAQTFSDVHVTVVDVNETSLEAGKAYAEQVMGEQQANEQTKFVCANFASFVEDNTSEASNENETASFDVVIAWHACGDLSDYALEFATRTNTSFIICPCCYTKRYIDEFQPKWISDYVSGIEFNATDIFCRDASPATPPRKPSTESLEVDIALVQRVAEINEHAEASQRAMLLINSMRLTSQRLMQLNNKKQCSDSNSVRHSTTAQLRLVLSLEKYGIQHSSKNLVLVGMLQCTPSTV